MKITQRDLELAVTDAGLPAENAHSIWQNLLTRSDAEAHFEPAHVGYYFGALLVIGAMGWFMSKGWDSFSGWQLSTISIGYAVIFLIVANRLAAQPLFRIPSGLLATMAVCMTPLAVYGIERQFNFWPTMAPGSYTNFHPYINANWVAMEIATVCAAFIALRFFKFPFLTAPAAYAIWYLSMDATALIFGRTWNWRDQCMISAVLGAIMLLVSYWFDGKYKLDYSFWGYLFGLMMFTGGLSSMGHGTQLGKFGYFLVHLALIAVSLVLRRRVFLIFGALGVFIYLCDEAYTYFRFSVAFPFVLTGIGLGLIFAAMQYKKHEVVLEQKIRSLLARKIAA